MVRQRKVLINEWARLRSQVCLRLKVHLGGVRAPTGMDALQA